MAKSNKIIEKKELILLFVIILQCVFIALLFAFKKEGYHSDEIWNYGFANSTDGEHIYTQNGEEKNCYEWLDSKILLEYLSVDKTEIFAYGSIYNNCANDINPPFQNMLLHLICSFFPNVWSRWFCFIVNIISFIITQIFLYKTIKIITDDKSLSLIGVLFFGFCAGAVNITIFLRIYALGVSFAMMYTYYSTKIYKESRGVKDYIKLFIVGFLGAMTIHMFLIISFAITLMYSLNYLFRKKYKKMFAYGMTAILFVLCSVLAFPSTITHLTTKDTAYNAGKLSLFYQISKYFEYISTDIIGIHNFANPTMIESIASLMIGLLLLVIFIVFYINRRKDKYIKFKNLVISYLQKIITILKKFGYPVIALFFSFLIYLIITSKMSSVGTMGEYSRRYAFLSYPLFACVVLILVKSVILPFENKIKNLNFAVLIVVVLLILLSHIFSDKAFYFKEKREGSSFDDIEKNAECIVVLDSAWLFTCATNELYDTDKFYLAERSDYEQDNYDTLEKSKNPVYLLLDVSNEYTGDEDDEDAKRVAKINGSMTDKQDILNYYKNLSISSGCVFEGCDYLFGRKIEIYKLTP